jgi:hypothetical protein
MVNPMTDSEAPKPKWDWKTWMIGILVAVGATSTYIAATISGQSLKGPKSMLGLQCASSHVVFEQKKRCGFVDMGELVTVEGLVIKTKIHTDGDSSINIRVDPGYERLLEYQGRKTRNYLHVEFMPCEREYVDVEPILAKVRKHYEDSKAAGVKPTMRVRVTGRWAYDGVDHRGKWRDQLGNCLGGRGPDPDVGWTEIHPAYTVEILNDDSSVPTEPDPT